MIMKLLTAALALFVSTAYCGFGVSFGGSQAPLVDDKVKVPGDNPLYFCSDPKDDILDITKVDLDPNPPKAYVSILSCHCLALLPSVRYLDLVLG